ncbi:MAG: SDR family oxidoreductase [Pseudomonadales bacterium]
MENLTDKIAVVTGAGSGIGRALTQLLVREGCHVAVCDVNQSSMEETLALCDAENPSGVTITGFACDVSDESALQKFVEDTRIRHATDHVDLLINNAGINGGGSFIKSPREEWERTFDICWRGVYLVTRNFLPFLMKSCEGHLVNMSSANALRAVLGGHVPHTAYSTAKFAVRGFSESLIHDFRFNAPHVSVSVVMPGHTGTNIISNSLAILGANPPDAWTSEDIQNAKRRWKIAGLQDVNRMTDEQVKAHGQAEIDSMIEFGLPPEDAAKIILDGVKRKHWRILIGTDTQSLDQLVRESPEKAYDPDFVDRWREANAGYTQGHEKLD